MDILAAITVGGLAGIGMWLLLDRNLIRVVVGVAVLGNAINLGVLTSGRFFGDVAAFVSKSGPVPEAAANPLPQALVLTAIVIGFGLFVFALALLKRVRETHGMTTTDAVSEVTEEAAPDLLQAQEPGGADGVRGAVERGRA
ncbi:MAG: NADH-quinone oxidoreductase subunit K [Rhodocyclaceae bacterium]|jgi:multicomponent Na+:H+ antiporter subunit C|nr:NADH-quinone oxidoreductase subunit K [Rhodocyclaceae bacterium]